MSRRPTHIGRVLGLSVIVAALALLPACQDEPPRQTDRPTESDPVPVIDPALAAEPSPPIAAPDELIDESPPTWQRPRFSERQSQRDRLVARLRGNYSGDEQLNERVLAAIAAVPRHEFVPASESAAAYANRPLLIGHGQTISQPYVVARMTQELRLRSGARVLEIGTGSGYQAAVLTEFTPHVYTIEIIQPLAEAAADRLARLGYQTAQVRHGDGYYGWAEAGPFDGIIVTAAAPRIPPPLVEQLAVGGRMIIPVGRQMGTQWLVLVEKEDDETVRTIALLPVLFVPFVHEGWDE
ncbi:MAG: protein-L-isoaspartate(D-aspartate) O-methyltransferase [Planctomycetota bacterium]|jgi:protein-L-isoaspartate(D-aspartate) O-methyltransferase